MHTNNFISLFSQKIIIFFFDNQPKRESEDGFVHFYSKTLVCVFLWKALTQAAF